MHCMFPLFTGPTLNSHTGGFLYNVTSSLAVSSRVPSRGSLSLFPCSYGGEGGGGGVLSKGSQEVAFCPGVSLSRGCLCPEVSLSRGCLCPGGVSVQRVSVQRCLSPGCVSVQVVSLSMGSLSNQGICVMPGE